MVRVEKALDQQETALGVFLDIEVAFNNAFYDSMCVALDKHGVDYTIIWWSRLPWRAGWLATPTLSGSFKSTEV
jgi:hypothetical protein